MNLVTKMLAVMEVNQAKLEGILAKAMERLMVELTEADKKSLFQKKVGYQTKLEIATEDLNRTKSLLLRLKRTLNHQSLKLMKNQSK